MDSQAARWKTLERLFNEALDRAPDQRAAYLAAACGDDTELRHEVERLLAANAVESMEISRIVAEGAAEAAAVVERAQAGARVGPWQLVRELGRGGMGAVWLAERADAEYKGHAAIKLIRPDRAGRGLIRRFLSERQILADLHHPNIAQLLGGGTTQDGRPWLAMEYIEGEPIDAFCNRRRLDVERRIDLFRKVCAAVQFAHANLVVHRDIKPANILVTEDGTPKLLDFGIAKILDPVAAFTAVETATGAQLLTPPYASPEQIRGGPVSTATDGYSLGVVLYELLTGRLPYRVDGELPHQLAEAILAQDPEPPSRAVTQPPGTTRPRAPTEPTTTRDVAAERGTTVERLRRRLSGDLDTILLTALRKEPDRRYASVERFAEDLRRYRERLPVTARPDTWRYRAGKFVKRNRGAVASALTVFLLVLFSAFSLAFQARSIANERDAANLERDKAERVAEFLVDVFEAADPDNTRGMEVTAREILAQGSDKVATELADQPDVQAAAMHAIGRVYRALGEYDSAATFLERSRDRRLESLGPLHPDYANSLDELGSLARLREDLESAERLHREALAIRRTTFGNEHADVAKSLSNIGVDRHDQGDFAAAESLYIAALDMRMRILGPEHAATATSLDNLGNLYTDQGRYDDAIRVGQEALEIRRTLFGTDHMDIAYALNNLASSFEFAGRYDEAEPLYIESLDIRRKILPEAHSATLVVMNNLGGLRLRTGDFAGAADILEEVVRLRRLNPVGDFALATPLSNLALAYSRMDRHAEAIPRFEEAITLMRRSRGERDLYVSFPLNGLAGSFVETGRHADAERAYREIVAIRKETYGPDGHPNLVFSLDSFGSFLLDRGRSGEAAPILEEAVSIASTVFTQSHPYHADALVSLGRLHLEAGRPADAEPILRQGADMRAELRGDDHVTTAQAKSLLGRALVQLGRRDEARPLLLECLPVLEASQAGDRWIRPARAALALTTSAAR